MMEIIPNVIAKKVRDQLSGLLYDVYRDGRMVKVIWSVSQDSLLTMYSDGAIGAL
jgi:hypothetical protein